MEICYSKRDEKIIGELVRYFDSGVCGRGLERNLGRVIEHVRECETCFRKYFEKVVERVVLESGR